MYINIILFLNIFPTKQYNNMLCLCTVNYVFIYIYLYMFDVEESFIKSTINVLRILYF